MATRKRPPPRPPNYMVLEKEGPADGERGTSDSKKPQAPGTHPPASKANAYQIIRQDAAIQNPAVIRVLGNYLHTLRPLPG